MKPSRKSSAQKLPVDPLGLASDPLILADISDLARERYMRQKSTRNLMEWLDTAEVVASLRGDDSEIHVIQARHAATLAAESGHGPLREPAYKQRLYAILSRLTSHRRTPAVLGQQPSGVTAALESLIAGLKEGTPNFTFTRWEDLAKRGWPATRRVNRRLAIDPTRSAPATRQ